MSTLAIVLLVLAGAVLLLLVGGLIALRSRRPAVDAQLARDLEHANHALAEAHAADRGWDRGRLEQAARDAFAARGGGEIAELLLVQVIDRPGTDDDRAVFRVVGSAGAHDVELVRSGDSWLAGGR